MTPSILDGVRHPKIYVYTTPKYADSPWAGKRRGKGLLKVGYTDHDVHARIKHSLEAVKMPTPERYDLLLVEAAVSNADVAFRDHSVHKQLEHAGVHRRKGEWFECTVEEVSAAVSAVRASNLLPNLSAKKSFPMRPEQQAAVTRTSEYFGKHGEDSTAPQFLWNAKMRFGKTFTAYHLAKAMGWTRVLVLTYKPAVEQAWREDLEEHVAFEGWRFKGKRLEDAAIDVDDPAPLVWFASFQDVLGTDESGNPKTKNEDLYLLEWDCVIIDEYHFGGWRDAARGIYLQSEGDATEREVAETPDLDEDFGQSLVENLTLDVRHFLFLSGTPFRALTDGEFLEDQIFNWTYSDEQRAKETWRGPSENPYEPLPRMHLLVYEMPDALKEVALSNRSEFSLSEFFRTQRDSDDGRPRFVYEKEVQKWLDLLRGQDLGGLWSSISSRQAPPLPYEDTNLLRALQHTVWYLPRVDACLAMSDLLKASHNTFFNDYRVQIAAGADAGVGIDALRPVEDAIGATPQNTKTITLSCGKLMTGVTLPAWAGIFMLRELKSPESYFQAAFRVQSPWAIREVDAEAGGEKTLVFKEQCFVFDFSPNRALGQIVDYATHLRADLASDLDVEAAIDELMEFLPVLSFDGYGMSRLNASDVVDFLTRGISSTMLARRWNSSELITLDLKAMEALLDDPELLESLERVEQFRDISQDLTMLISSNKELAKKKLAKEPLTKDEKQLEKSAVKRRENLKKKLQRFLTRIPAFMYLTDLREKALKDLITHAEPELFQQVTQLTVGDFSRLLEAGVFSDSKMNDAVWKFRAFEEPSLDYDGGHVSPVVGGWSVGRDKRFARLMEEGIITAGDQLYAPDGSVAEISEDFGILVDGIRYTTPLDAALAISSGEIQGVGDAWEFWTIERNGTMETLSGLETHTLASVSDS